jgi:ribosome maturation factor RimP
VDYIEPDKIPYFNDCEPLISGLGFKLVELVVFRKQSSWQVKVVLTGAEGVGIADCTKVHRALLPRLEAILSSQDMYVEVASPGLDRILKNALEFSVFSGKNVKVWNTDISDWMQGVIVSSTKEAVTLSTEQGEQTVPYNKIAKAKLFDRA